MDEPDLTEALFARMLWNAPLSAAHADLLLDRLELRPGLTVADIGCGWGELLLRAAERVIPPDTGPGTRVGASLAAAPGAGLDTEAGAGLAAAPGASLDTEAGAPVPATGTVLATGVDTDTWALDRGRRAARDRGLAPWVTFAEASAPSWRQQADRVLCVGAPHAFGGTAAALAALADLVPAGGRLLFGDGCWTTPPSHAALEIFGDEVLPLPDLLEACRSAGWRLIHLTTAGQREWDVFESTFRAGRQEWLLAHPDDPRAAEVRDWLDLRERQYVTAYRGLLGFAYLVLAH